MDCVGILAVYILKMKKYTSAVRSTKEDFDQNSALKAENKTKTRAGTILYFYLGHDAGNT